MEEHVFLIHMLSHEIRWYKPDTSLAQTERRAMLSEVCERDLISLLSCVKFTERGRAAPFRGSRFGSWHADRTDPLRVRLHLAACLRV